MNTHTHSRRARSCSAYLRAFAYVVFLLPSLAVAQPATIYHNAIVYTVDDDAPIAQALAITGHELTAVGDDDAVLALAGPDTVLIDLAGRTVLPGLIDAHGHLAGLGELSLGVLDLSDTTTYEQVIDRVRARAAETPPGEWIIGRGWDQESWPDKALPSHVRLSEAVPDNPVLLRRVDGHALLANRAAMAAAHISPESASPAGGEVMKTPRGEPTGVFVDMAKPLIESAVPESAWVDLASSLLAAQERCFAAGITGAHDMGVTPEDLETYEALAASGDLKLRTYVAIYGSDAPEYFDSHGLTIGDTLTVRAAKLFMDGAMGSRGAWMLAPYTDRPTDADGLPYTGLNLTDPKEVARITKDGLEHGYQICVHAIGDRANREVLDAYERAHADYAAERRDPDVLARALVEFRFRIEHAQLIDRADIPRFAALGVIPSMQPKHCTSDMRWVDARVGPERARGAYAWRSLTDSGAPIAAGSDFPVEPENPFLGFHSAVTRQNGDSYPPGGWHPEQKLTRSEALEAFTIHAAHAAFEEERKGSLEPGKLADFIVLDRDVMTCPEADILGTRVLTTVLGGEVVYEAADAIMPTQSR